MKIKKGDNVLVIKGRDRGKKGKVVKVFPEEGKVQIEGVNIRKKHMKPKRGGQKGQTVELFVPVSVSSVQLLCPKCGKPARIGIRVAPSFAPSESRGASEGKGLKKFRMCKRCKSEI